MSVIFIFNFLLEICLKVQLHNLSITYDHGIWEKGDFFTH